MSTPTVEPPAHNPDDNRSNSPTTPRTRFSTQVSIEIADRARNAVVGVSLTTRTNYTLAQLTEDALLQQARQLEETYNDGQPFPKVQPLRRGRRVGATGQPPQNDPR